MKKPLSLWALGAIAGVIAFGVMVALQLFLNRGAPGQPVQIDWHFVVFSTGSVTGIVVIIAHRVRSQPSSEQIAALAAIYRAGPGTRGAVVVTRNGVPEVLATVRSKEEYQRLLASGRFPQDHSFFMPNDT